LEACKQCRRPIPMQVHPPLPLSALPLPKEGSKIMPWEGEGRRPFPRTLPPAPVLLLIGPEGGFHASELLYARNADFITVSLGPRILRAETAALSSVVLAQQALHSPPF
jgi:16S rRNA (uracil1498-N3)-methyltransferase